MTDQTAERNGSPVYRSETHRKTGEADARRVRSSHGCQMIGRGSARKPRALAAMLLLALTACGAEIEDAKMLDRYLSPLAELQLARRVETVNALQTPAAIEARQTFIREQLLQQIGGLPERTPLHARVTGVLEHADYTVEKVVFESLPHYYVTANVYVPKNAHPPFPAVLGAAGHSLSGKALGTYQRTWVSLVKRGILVLAWDPPGQGERIQYLDTSGNKSQLGGGGTGEHTMAGIQCLLTGTNIARYFIWDGMRALDYLLERGDVDPRRIGVTGNSGGGTMTSYLAALDSRLAVAAPSCYLTSWSTLWQGQGPQDAEQVFVNFIADGLDFADFVISFAPKPLQMAAATRDYFPIKGARATFAEAQRIYTHLGAGEKIGFFEFDDTHGWSQPRREATSRWFSKWLLGREEDGKEPDFETDTPEALRCTPTGQVGTSYTDAVTIQSLNARLAREMYPKRTASRPGDLTSIVRQRLGITKARQPGKHQTRTSVDHPSYRIESVILTPEPGIDLYAVVFIPLGGPAKKPAVLYLDPVTAGKEEERQKAIEALVGDGNVVLEVDPRGTGASTPRGRSVGGYSPAYSTTMRSLLVGRTLPGMQTEDVLSAYDYLTSLNVTSDRIRLVGKNDGAVPALFAALLEPRIARVTIEGGPESYLALTQAATHRNLLSVVVPGVLRDFDLPDIRTALGDRLETSPGTTAAAAAP